MYDQNYYRPQSEGDNVLGSVRPFIPPLMAEPFGLNALKNKQNWLKYRKNNFDQNIMP